MGYKDIEAVVVVQVVVFPEICSVIVDLDAYKERLLAMGTET